MTVADILSKAKAAGPYVFLRNGQLDYIGDQLAIDSILPELKQHKNAIIQHLVETTFVKWMVNTTDRGTIKVTCAPPHTLAEIIDAVPGAISAIPLLDNES